MPQLPQSQLHDVSPDDDPGLPAAAETPPTEDDPFSVYALLLQRNRCRVELPPGVLRSTAVELLTNACCGD